MTTENLKYFLDNPRKIEMEYQEYIIRRIYVILSKRERAARKQRRLEKYTLLLCKPFVYDIERLICEYL